MRPTAHIARLLKISPNTDLGVTSPPGGEFFLFDWRCGPRFSDQMCEKEIHKSKLTQNDLRKIRKERSWIG